MNELEVSPDCALVNNDTIITILKRKKSQLEAKLRDVNDALAALEKYPEVANVLTLVSKVTRNF